MADMGVEWVGLKSDGIAASIEGFSYGLGGVQSYIGIYMKHPSPKTVPCE